MARRKSDGQGNRARLFPMPVEPIIDHPGLKNASSVVYGSVMRILHHYWACECAPLPDATREIESIGRMTEHLWRNHGEIIMSVVNDILPDLDHYYDVRITRRSTLKDLSDRAIGTKALKAMRQSDAAVRAKSTGTAIPVKSVKRVDVAPRIAPVLRNSDVRRRTD